LLICRSKCEKGTKKKKKKKKKKKEKKKKKKKRKKIHEPEVDQVSASEKHRSLLDRHLECLSVPQLAGELLPGWAWFLCVRSLQTQTKSASPT
jgi:hypothetical protein